MPYRKVQIGGANGTVYELPEGLSFETFNWDRTFAILKEGLGGPFKRGAKVIDSIDIRMAGGNHKSQIATARDFLTRHGAKPVEATPA